MRGKRRSDMTPDELAHVRKLDREKHQRRRMKLNLAQKEEIKKKDRERRAEARKQLKNDEKERIGISNLIRMRKYRLMQTEDSKNEAKNKAKKGMRILRKEGPIRKYLERKKKHKWAVKWRRFLSQNPSYKELEEKKQKNNK